MITIIRDGSPRDILNKALEKLRVKKRFDAKKYSGVLKLKSSPILIQKKMRDEWK